MQAHEKLAEKHNTDTIRSRLFYTHSREDGFFKAYSYDQARIADRDRICSAVVVGAVPLLGNSGRLWVWIHCTFFRWLCALRALAIDEIHTFGDRCID